MSRRVARSEQSIAWDLRGHWAKQRVVVVTLSKRCMVRRIEGRVEYVSVTGAFAVVDGWHVPCADVLGVVTAHHSQRRERTAVAA